MSWKVKNLHVSVLEFLTCETQIHYFGLVFCLIGCLKALLLRCCRGLRWITVSDDHHALIAQLHWSSIVHLVSCADWVAERWLGRLRYLAIWLRWCLSAVLALARSSSCLRVHVIISWTDQARTHRIAVQDGLMDRLTGVFGGRIGSRWVIVRRLYLHCDNSVWDVGEVRKYIECKLCKLDFAGVSNSILFRSL